MNDLLFYLALVNLLICLVVSYRLIVGGRSLRHLRDVEPLAGPLPSVSVVVPARNEERHIAAALQSLLALDYDNIEITVVNDRSTDRTGAILDELAKQHPRLNVVHIQELPPGWLGKNHALDFGAARSRGEWLLFTDADVVMERSTLRRAVAFAQSERLDHLAMLFSTSMPNWLLESFVLTFSIFFFTYFRPWKARDPESTAYIGVGGFNLLRAEVYRQVGTHQAIAMRPDDDVKLGKIVKKHGFRQDLAVATDFMVVPWYASFRELVSGLEKNAFSGVEYRIWVVVGATSAMLLFNVFPYLAVFVTHGWTRGLYIAVVLSLFGMCWMAAMGGGFRRSCAFGFPLAVLLFVYIEYRTMIVNLWSGGIRWRDTHYPLAELRANKV